jgi:Arf-GAP/SH3 domain/ANK repeat/PH domain-containing protein
MEPIDLRVASVREARNADRRFCFEIITPNFTRVYQAVSEDDMKSWIYTINNALQSAVETGKYSGPSVDSPVGTGRKDFASALTGKSYSQREKMGYAANKMVGRHATVGERPAQRSVPESTNSAESLKVLQMLRDADAANLVCADCNSENKVDWVSINLGVIICIECSGIHRSLGTHISKVRSLTLDPNAFTTDVIEVLLTLGNQRSNAIWEATMDPTLKPTPQATRDQRLRFITSKYGDRAFVASISPSTSHFGTADETLIASIKQNAITDVAYALALRANPNVVDRSRGTHAIFLALAAADPAMPSPPPVTSSISRPIGTPPTVRKAFPIAELLMLNGAELPSTPPPIPLSRAGQEYLNLKLDQRSGRRTTVATPATGFGTPNHTVNQGYAGDRSSGNGDTITALPLIGSNAAAGVTSSPEGRRKRLSSGGLGNKLQKATGPPG